MADRQIILSEQEALVGADLELSFRAVRADQSPAGVIPRYVDGWTFVFLLKTFNEFHDRFKKKEDISRMTKSILKHKIQTLTGKNIKQLEDAMGYKVALKTAGLSSNDCDVSAQGS